MQILYEISSLLGYCPIRTIYLSQLVPLRWKTPIDYKNINPVQSSRSFVIMALICVFGLKPQKGLSLKISARST